MPLNPAEMSQAIADRDAMDLPLKDNGRWIQIVAYAPRPGTLVWRDEYMQPDGQTGFSDVVEVTKGTEVWINAYAYGPRVVVIHDGNWHEIIDDLD